ncbi:MAG: 50S ribosomal protein L9 [Candidatus Omnitrophica bacterium]|nr:50S ribosomal protein L9 [Candidatus Omnitrophota bacterium]
MKVLIIRKVGKFNEEGSVVEVKDGFARNFLIPKGFAMAATKENYRRLEEIKKDKVKLEEKEKKVFEELKDKLEKLSSLTITAKVKDDEEIFGSIGEPQILKALKDEGITLEKGLCLIEEPIKKLGVYSIKVNLHPEVQAKLRVWIVKK